MKGNKKRVHLFDALTDGSLAFFGTKISHSRPTRARMAIGERGRHTHTHIHAEKSLEQTSQTWVWNPGFPKVPLWTTHRGSSILEGDPGREQKGEKKEAQRGTTRMEGIPSVHANRPSLAIYSLFFSFFVGSFERVA